MFPVNLRSLPTCMEELVLDNWLTTFNHQLPIGNNIEACIQKSKDYIKRCLKPEYLLAADKSGIVLHNFPNKFLRKFIVEESLKELDLSFSNLPYQIICKILKICL